MEQIIVITGPTAVGKTDFAIECARIFNGEIISADSMQIYKNLDIGTAKPTLQEQSIVKHYLINEVEANSDFSVQEFVSRAKECITDIIARGKIPIIVGGTGLYIKSLIYPYSFASSPKNDEIRNKYKTLLEKEGKEYIYKLLQEKDLLASQKIHVNDTKKVIRALEICELTGSQKSKLNNEDLLPCYDAIIVALNLPRTNLYDRINARVDIMFENGLLDEVKSLLQQNKISKDCQSMQAIGYKELFPYLEGKIDLDSTKELIKQNSRHYAKRQLTFIRGLHNVAWFDAHSDKEQIYKFIKGKMKNGN